MNDLFNARKEIDIILNLYRNQREKYKIFDNNIVNNIDNFIYDKIINNNKSNLNYQVKLQSSDENILVNNINKLLGYNARDKPKYVVTRVRQPTLQKQLSLNDEIYNKNINLIIKMDTPTKYIKLYELDIDYKSKYFDYVFFYPYVIMDLKEEYKHKPFLDEFNKEKTILIENMDELKKDEDEYYCLFERKKHSFFRFNQIKFIIIEE